MPMVMLLQSLKYYDSSAGELEGRTSRLVDAVGNETLYDYDLVTRTTTIDQRVSPSELATSTVTYNEMGYVTRRVNAIGDATEYTYDENFNELEKTVDADGLALTTSYTYNENGHQTSIQNPDLFTIAEMDYNQYGGHDPT